MNERVSVRPGAMDADEFDEAMQTLGARLIAPGSIAGGSSALSASVAREQEASSARIGAWIDTIATEARVRIRERESRILAGPPPKDRQVPLAEPERAPEPARSKETGGDPKTGGDPRFADAGDTGAGTAILAGILLVLACSATSGVL